MMPRRVLGYPIVFGVPYSPLPGFEEVVAPSVLKRALREREPIKLLLNHDWTKEVGCADDGTLQIQVDAHGVRVELADIPDSPAGRELLAALDAGMIRGGSFGWTPLRNRWHLDRRPVRASVVDAVVHELSIIISPKEPRYASTWVGMLGPQMHALYRRLDGHRTRFAPPARAAEPPADLVLELQRQSFGMWTPLLRLFVDQMVPEWRQSPGGGTPASDREDHRRCLSAHAEILSEGHGPPIPAAGCRAGACTDFASSITRS